jgi:hypothetical protein
VTVIVLSFLFIIFLLIFIRFNDDLNTSESTITIYTTVMLRPVLTTDDFHHHTHHHVSTTTTFTTMTSTSSHHQMITTGTRDASAS